MKANYIEMTISLSIFTDSLEQYTVFKDSKRVNKDDKQAKDEHEISVKTVTVIIEYVYIQIGLYYILSLTVGNKKYKVNRLINLKQSTKNKMSLGSNCSLLNSRKCLIISFSY